MLKSQTGMGVANIKVSTSMDLAQPKSPGTIFLTKKGTQPRTRENKILTSMQKSENGPGPTFRGCGQYKSTSDNTELFSELVKSNDLPHGSAGLMLNSFSSNKSVTSNSGRQTPSVCTELEKAHTRLLGVSGYPRVQNSFYFQPHSKGNPKDSGEQRGGHLHFGGGSVSP